MKAPTISESESALSPAVRQQTDRAPRSEGPVPPPGDPAGLARTSGPSARPRIDSRSLFAHSRQIVISHFGVDYVLRVTGQNKLILTK